MHRSQISLRLFSLMCLLLAWYGIVEAQGVPAPFLTRPDVHGDKIVFTAEGDLWLASLTDGRAQRITTHPGVETSAHFSPDGSMLAFVASYDSSPEVYTMPANGGEPKRLTYEGAHDVRYWNPEGSTAVIQDVVGWTPDGQYILYTACDGQTREAKLKKIPARGGMPQILPVPTAAFAALNQDAHRLAYVPVSATWQHWFHYRGGQADAVWLTDLTAHTFRRLTDDLGINTMPVWAGDSLYCVSERGGIANLCRLDLRTGKSTPVTHYSDYAIRAPASDGKKIVFEHGYRLAAYDPATNKTTELSLTLPTDRIHTRVRHVPSAASLNSVAIGPTGKRLLIESRGQLLSVPVESGAVRTIAPLPGSRTQFPAWSADGKQVAFVSDRSGEDQIWLCASSGEEAPRQLTHDHKGPFNHLIWSPDGKQIASSDREARLLLVDTGNGTIAQIHQSPWQQAYDDSFVTDFHFSPDGKWLAYAKPESSWRASIYLYDIVGKKSTRLTRPEMNCFAPVFDPSGKYLFFLADRQLDRPGAVDSAFFTYSYLGITNPTRISVITLAGDTPSPFLIQNDAEGGAVSSHDEATSIQSRAPVGLAAAKLPIVKVDLEGIADRVIDVLQPAGNYTALEALDGHLLIYSNDMTLGTAPAGSNGQILTYDLKKQQSILVADHLSGYDLSADQKKLLLRSGSSLAVVDTPTMAIVPGTGSIDLTSVNLIVEPPLEWKQMFYEAWRVARDFFYAPNMHGVDWQAVKRKYEAQLPAIADRSDLNRLLGDMIAELNIGHAFIGGGDMGDLKHPLPMGYLGADIESLPNADAVRITKLLPGDGFDLEARSPLLTPGIGVKPGDYILAINEQAVRRDQDIQALLQGTAGKVIALTVNSKPILEGARQIYVRPMANETKARYAAWAAGRQEYVRTHGGENFGYVHLPNMVLEGEQEFYKHYYSNLDKDAIIVDVRNNTGGYISAQLLQQMASRPYFYFSPRHGTPWTRNNWGFTGYFAALCNENSASNAEEFSSAFQRLKLGPLIGMRTWGGEVGSGNGYALLDGGLLYVPNYGGWEPGEQGKPGHWIVEGVGSEPDIVVEQDPAAVLAGRDPQLDRAIDYLKAQLAKHPITRPVTPPYPNKAVKPGIIVKP